MQDIYQHIEDHIDESIKTLFRLVSQPSISAQRLGFDKAPDLVKEIFESVGLETEIVPVPNDGLPSVYGKTQGSASGRTLLFYTHYDVQPTDPIELWESDPFKPERRGDRLYGRGISDDKGNIIARIAALRAFNEVRGGLPCNIKLFAEGEEESGSINLPDLVELRGQDFSADACIWEGGGRNASNDPFMYLGLKGVLTVELNTKRLSVDAHSSLATVLPSAAWRLLDALKTIKGDNDRVLIDGFYDDITPLSEAEDAAIGALPDETEELRKIYGARDFVNEVEGEALRRKLYLTPTANIAGLTSGYQGTGFKTVLPAEASAKMDFRLVPEMRPRDIFDKLRRHLDRHGFSDVETTLIGGVNPYRTTMDAPWVKLVAETAEEIYGRAPVITPNMAGTGPMYDFGHTIGMPIATSGVDHPAHNIHAPNENITIEDFLLGAKQAALIIERFAEHGACLGDEQG
jgi:acetylornithine deacetylase/succinyl-diaminopimelate desuccinylase-like protein